MQQLKIYDKDKNLDKNKIRAIIYVLLKKIKVKSDRELANGIKQILNKTGLTIYKVYCSGNTKQYKVTIASKSVTFEQIDASFIVAKLISNRKESCNNTQA